MNIPSYTLNPGDEVAVRERSKSLSIIRETIAEELIGYPWLSWDQNALKGTFLEMPERDKIPENIKEQLIIELYSK